MRSFLFFVVVFFALATFSEAALSQEERREKASQIFNECKSAVGATDDEVQKALEKQMPETRSHKCLMACAKEKIGVIVDGKVSADGFKAMGAMKYGGNDKATAIFNEMVDECASTNDDDKCELAAKLIACMVNAAVKRGIDPKKGIE